MLKRKGRLWEAAADMAERVGVRDRYNQWHARKQAALADQAFEEWRRSADVEAMGAEVTAVILTVEGSHLFERCLRSVEDQSLRPCAIEVVKDVTPFSKASQAALDCVKTRCYSPVDDDMILSPGCFERLYFTLTAAGDCAEALAMLKDPFMGEIKGVRMYRTEVVRKIGFYPLQDEKGCERNMAKSLKVRGFTSTNSFAVEGDHHPEYLPHEAFYKFKLAAEKSRYYQDSVSPRFQDMVNDITVHWQKNRDRIALYAMAGLFAGLQSEEIDRELNYDDREGDGAFQKVKAFLDGTEGRG